MHRLPLHALAVSIVAGLALLVGAGPAFAHTRLVSSDPAEGASLATPPERVSLTFSETLQPGFVTITIIGPQGESWQVGDAEAAGATASIAARPLGPVGRYEIGYRILSSDGHPVTGSLTFTLTTAGPGTGTPATPAPKADAAAPDDSAGTPVWPWIVGAAVLVAGGVTAALRLIRG